jgi:hypothetical protein
MVWPYTADPMAVKLPSFPMTARRTNGTRKAEEVPRIGRALTDLRNLRNKLERYDKYISPL